jgi:hypothetical protein
MSNFIPDENQLGIQPIAQTNAALPSQYQTGQSQFFGQVHPLGKIVRAYDATLGEGEFIYLLGVANTAVGNTVTYNATTFQTTLSPNTANNVDPVAVAMSANVAGQYGWYQIAGLATVLKTAVQVLPGAKMYQSATAGRWMSTSASGKEVLGARAANLTTVTSTTSTIVVLINRPSMQGQIT